MVSTLKIELNGTLITGRIDGTENFSITYSKNEDGLQTASFSSELTFYDDGYNILKTILMDDPLGFVNTVSVRIFDECCGKMVFEGIIRGDAIDWCSDGCYISANIIEDDEQTSCIKNTLIYDNWNQFLQRNAHRVYYCIEVRPEFIQYVITWLGGLIKLIAGPILAFVAFGVSIFDRDTANDIRDLLNQLKFWTVPCGRYHNAALVRDYIQNVCDKCNLSFQSSIFNDSNSLYYDTVLLAAMVERGNESNSLNNKLNRKNLPIETLDTLMKNYLMPMFNAEYKIINGTFIFETKGYWNTNTAWIDVNTLLNNGKIQDDKICWSWIDKDRYAFGNYKYGMDASDYVGNEAIERWSDIVEWNSPPSKGQKGSKEVFLQNAAARFREDGIDKSYFDTMADNGLIDFIFGGRFSNFKRALIIPKQTFFSYKFLILDQNKPGYIQGIYNNTITGQNFTGILSNQRFNYPYWFKEGIQGLSGYQNNLYSLYHYIDNPREPSAERFNFNFEFAFECDTFDTFSFDKTVGGLNLNGNIVTGKINEIVVNFTNRTIKVTGIV